MSNNRILELDKVEIGAVGGSGGMGTTLVEVEAIVPESHQNRNAGLVQLRFNQLSCTLGFEVLVGSEENGVRVEP